MYTFIIYICVCMYMYAQIYKFSLLVHFFFFWWYIYSFRADHSPWTSNKGAHPWERLMFPPPAVTVACNSLSRGGVLWDFLSSTLTRLLILPVLFLQPFLGAEFIADFLVFRLFPFSRPTFHVVPWAIDAGTVMWISIGTGLPAIHLCSAICPVVVFCNEGLPRWRF